MKFIVGLGNPGEKYARTRHNLGWWVVDRLAEARSAARTREDCEGVIMAAGDIGLFKPLTFMNHSGRAVAKLARKQDLKPSELVVVMDDLDLELGTIRLRSGGSSGGHRGLQSVMDHLGTREVPRLRLGIGPCPKKEPARSFVLSRFSREEMPLADRMVECAADCAVCWSHEGLQTAMSRFNGPVCEDLTDTN